MLGTYALSAGYYEAYYGQAQKVRTLIIRDYERMFEDFDLLVSPTSPTTAFAIGDKVDDPMAMYLNDIFTIPANLAGVPAISVPCGLDADGLPVGLQLTAPVLGEQVLLRAANALEGTSASSSVRHSSPASESASSRATPPAETVSATAASTTAPASSDRPRTGSSLIRYPR